MSGIYKDLDKTRAKLSPNFTRHHLITHTYYYDDDDDDDDDDDKKSRLSFLPLEKLRDIVLIQFTVVLKRVQRCRVS